MLTSDWQSDCKVLKIDRVKTSESDHQFDMKLLLLLIQRCKCSWVLNSL